MGTDVKTKEHAEDTLHVIETDGHNLVVEQTAVDNPEQNQSP
jgi:hypothetical protein